MDKSLDNKEETTYRRAKERQNTKNHQRVTRQLKNTAKQKEDRVN
jgi:hypothetical protein